MTAPGPHGAYTSDWESTLDDCPNCACETVQRREWESDCGGFEDAEFRCTTCGYVWWVDGPDA